MLRRNPRPLGRGYGGARATQHPWPSSFDSAPSLAPPAALRARITFARCRLLSCTPARHPAPAIGLLEPQQRLGMGDEAFEVRRRDIAHADQRLQHQEMRIE